MLTKKADLLQVLADIAHSTAPAHIAEEFRRQFGDGKPLCLRCEEKSEDLNPAGLCPLCEDEKWHAEQDALREDDFYQPEYDDVGDVR